MNHTALKVVMQLGGLTALLKACSDEDLAELHQWAVHAFDETHRELAHVIACEQQRRKQ